jgi:hypothetical protein
MTFFTRVVSVLALRSERPIMRLLAYYIPVIVIIIALAQFFPVVDRTFLGERTDQLLSTPQLLRDGLAAGQAAPVAPTAQLVPRLEFALGNLLVFLGTLIFMLPVSWVYMSARKDRTHNQSLAQTLIILPLVVAGIVLVVQNSLALAFSLAGVVAAVRFRTTLSDVRDTVFIFLAIAVGFAAGVHMLSVAAQLSMVFNLVVLMIWRSDYGRSALEANASTRWQDPLRVLSAKDEVGDKIPDRDLMLALTPKKAEMLAKRFGRISSVIGSNGDKPKYSAVLTVTTNVLSEAQQHVENVLESSTKRWKLDEVVTNSGKPSVLYYLVRFRKSIPSDALVTEMRASSNGSLLAVDLEVGNAVAIERVENKELQKEGKN